MFSGFRPRSIIRYGFNNRTWVLYLLLGSILFLVAARFQSCELIPEVPAPPKQPASGPGGADYPYTEVTRNVYGKGNNQYWIFEPASPSPQSAPLIVFNHGWGAMQPMPYGAWIEHIVRKGNIVIYPRYQAILRTPTETMTQNAINAVKDAISRLQSGGHVMPQLDKFAIVGHSLGGTISANMAALAASVGLPQPKALMVVEPADPPETTLPFAQNEPSMLGDYNTIPANILMLVVIGSDDGIVFDITAKTIFNHARQVSFANKNFVTIVTDSHGEPPLIADHFAPVAPNQDYSNGGLELGGRTGEVDALDYYGFWKLLDGLTDAAFYGKNREYALGNSLEQRFMGKWSDGTPVKELVVTDKL